MSPYIYDPGRHRRRSMTRVELAGAWVTDRLPLALRSRVTIGGRELGLIALVGAVALCAAAMVALRASAAAATPAHIGPALVAASARAAPLIGVSPDAKGSVVVDVAGAVVHPRVVTLPAGSRVYEALKAAGGARRGIDVTGLNLARVVVDGEQIVVGRTAPATSSGGAVTPGVSKVVNINSASESELDELPGVGPVTAKNIIAWRDAHGRFSRIEELEEVTGIGPKTLAKLKPLIGL